MCDAIEYYSNSRRESFERVSVQHVARGINGIPLRMRSAGAVFREVFKQTLEAFYTLVFHYLCKQHVVDAD